MTISGVIGLIVTLKDEIKPLEDDSKVFIYFSDMRRTDYQQIYKKWNRLLTEDNYNSNGIHIELVVEDDL